MKIIFQIFSLFLFSCNYLNKDLRKETSEFMYKIFLSRWFWLTMMIMSVLGLLYSIINLYSTNN